MSEPTPVQLSRAERRKQQTHELIKQAAGELLLERGYPALTVQAITERADVGYGTFYLHFGDKDDVVWAVMHDLAQAYRAQVDAQLVDVPYPRKEYLGWLAIFRYVGTIRDQFVAYFGSQGSAKLVSLYQAYLAQMTEENIREARYMPGLDLPIGFTAQYMAGALMRLLVWWCETRSDYTPEQMAAMLFEIVYRQPPPKDSP